MRILADASLPGLIHAFPKPFELSLYEDHKDIPSLLEDQQILLCRSTLCVNENLLKKHRQSLRYVATASSGIDHIDLAYLNRFAITLFDAKGSNRIAVADYVLASLAYLHRFNDFSGKTAGVIGVGQVGAEVVKRLQALGMNVLSNDPLKALVDPHFNNHPLECLLDCDLIAIHANLHEKTPYPSKNLLNDKFLRQLSAGTVIINAARGGIVDEEALLNQKGLIYCTDVYENEPNINKKIVDYASLCTPHIAGHSIEAKSLAVTMLSEQLHASLKLNPPPGLLSNIDLFNDLTEQGPWQDYILSLYNPIHETTALKMSDNLKLSFQTLRKAHQHRHDFCRYK